MPNYKKQKTNKISIQNKINTDAFKESFDKVSNSKLVGYIQRQARKKSAEHTASERFSEYSEKNKEKKKLKDANEPLTLQEKGTNYLKKIISYVKVHKAPRDERSVRHLNPKLVLAILGVLCLALIILSAVNEKVRKPFNTIASVIVVPAQKGFNSIGLWISDKIELQKSIDELKEENAGLKDQIAELTDLVSGHENDRLELERLRELVKLADEYDEYEMEAAHIIAKNTGKWFATFTIDKGSRDGIKKDMNVIADGGLVGIIIDAGLNFSTVRSIIDDESFVSAKFQNNSELCMINGSLTLAEQNLLEFSNVSADVEIPVNGAVVTSHVSSKYLPDLLIGNVVDFNLDGNDLTQSGHIKPVVDFNNLEEVLIITTLKEISD